MLRPGGLAILSFSSHCFAEKAIAGWLSRSSMQDKAELVRQLLAAAGLPAAELVLWEPPPAAAGPGSGGDPFAAVVAARQRTGGEQAEHWTPPALQGMQAAGDSAPSAAALERW